jgi:hypothetical protein
MLTIEYCLEKLDEINWDPPVGQLGVTLDISNTWDRRFISDVCFHSRQSKPITTAQGELAMKIITRYRDHLIASGLLETEVDTLILVPSYRIAPHMSTVVPREVRWLGDSKLAFRCKYNAMIIEEIKKLKGINHFEDGFPTFNREWKLWVVDINSANWERAMELIRRHRFAFDSSVEMFFLECANATTPSTADVVGDQIKIEVRNDDLLSCWMNNLIDLERTDV